MREIPNKTTSLPLKADGKPVLFSDLLRTALDFTPPGGFDPATLRARARVDKALETVGEGDLIKLEDADYATAQVAVGGVRWVGRHPDYLAFADAFGV